MSAVQDNALTVGLFTPFLAVIGIMLKVLLKPDTRWEGLIEEQRKQFKEMEADRDYWRDRAINHTPDRRHDDA